MSYASGIKCANERNFHDLDQTATDDRLRELMKKVDEDDVLIEQFRLDKYALERTISKLQRQADEDIKVSYNREESKDCKGLINELGD